MTFSARRYGELRRDALEDLGEGMKRWIAGAHMTPLDENGKFDAHRFVVIDRWCFCDRCGAPASPLPHSFGAFDGEVSPTFVCLLCDLRHLDRWMRTCERRLAQLLPPLELVEVS